MLRKIFTSIENDGFLGDKSIVPLGRNGTIYNGAHRIACSIYLNRRVTAIQIDLPPMICDYKYFYDRNVPVNFIEMAVNKFIEYSSDVYIAFLWPSGKKRISESEILFSNILYKKVGLSKKGAFNLLACLYEDMDWVGSKNDGYPGINNKLIECFPTFDPVKVIAFQAENIGKVREIKKNIRLINNIGYSSVHITDNIREALKISNLLFNDNGLHFLNNSTPHQYVSLDDDLKRFDILVNEAGIKRSKLIIDGGAALSVYGIRKNSDIDFLLDGKVPAEFREAGFEPHDDQIIFHKRNKLELIYSPENHFIYFGFKFISFDQLYRMKKYRNEKKDENDCKLMESLCENKKYMKLLAKVNQKILYKRLKLHNFIVIFIVEILKKLKLYSAVRKAYHHVMFLLK
ncbi:hypothetical protein [Microbulbifer taiwanensis]|uniref:hypothetical protein n=1 Tax=Microbulbifer taiwanensis TaxID=986746 RepID=UPI0036174F7A